MNNRRSYLLNQKSMGLATPDELQELNAMPIIIYGEGGGALVLPAPVPGDTLDEQMANFVAMGQGRKQIEGTTDV